MKRMRKLSEVKLYSLDYGDKRMEKSILNKMSTYEQTLLYDNKRLRDFLINIADYVRPAWREIGMPLNSDWILAEIKDRERNVNTLLDVLDKQPKK